jgi:hypothetical protein
MDDDYIKAYKDIIVKRSNDYDIVMSALNVVKQYILKNGRVLVGGIAIDYALKLKSQKGIYAIDALPDYDIVSDKHYQDAYAIATILSRKGFTGISVINALHPSTMKVRINFKELIDITYVPTNILHGIPTLNYHGFEIVHPHYQYIDQHRSLSYPYENEPRETIFNRPLKDMTRYDLLYNVYPMRIINVADTKLVLKEFKISMDIIENQCIGGFVALNYWIAEARSMGFQANYNLGKTDFKSDNIGGYIPFFPKVVIYTNTIKNIYDKIGEDAKFYARILDKVPQRIEYQNLQIYDLEQKIAAHKITKHGKVIYICNLQAIMMNLLLNYILLQNIRDNKRDYAYYAGYIICRDIIIWASKLYYSSGATDKEKLKLFFPTSKTYGERNLSDSYIVAKHNFDVKNKTNSDKNKYSQPTAAFDRDLLYKKVPKRYYEMSEIVMRNSEVFKLSGAPCDNFL